MKHLLPLFLMFSFSAKATNFSKNMSPLCSLGFDTETAENQTTPDELAQIQELAHDILGKSVTSQQVRGLAFLGKKLSYDKFYPDQVSQNLRTLKKLEEQGFSKNDINNIFIPVMLNPRFDKKGELQNYIGQGQRIAFKILNRKFTPYQALQLTFLNMDMLSEYDITATEVAKTLQDIGRFSKKEIVRFIINRSNAQKYNFSKKIVGDLAYGQKTAHEILERSATPEQALALFFLDKDLKDVSKTSKNDISKTLEELGFSREDINKLIDNSSDSGFKVKGVDELTRGEELALGILGEPVTPKQAQGLFLLEKELLYDAFHLDQVSHYLRTLKKLEEQGFSEKEIDNIFIPVMLDSKLNRGRDSNFLIKWGQDKAFKILGKSATPYQALKLFLK